MIINHAGINFMAFYVEEKHIKDYFVVSVIALLTGMQRVLFVSSWRLFGDRWNEGK